MDSFDRASAKHKMFLDRHLDKHSGIGWDGSTLVLGELASYHEASEARQRAHEDCHAAAVKKAREDSQEPTSAPAVYLVDRDQSRTRYP
jgi:hypothetical protein